MNDILYIVKKPSLELRYSLRGLGRFGKNIGRVFVCSNEEIPFLSDNVIFVKHNDEYEGQYKHKNILSAIEYCAKNTDISEHFFYSSDDHFYIKETDFETLPFYYKFGLERSLSNKDKDRYCKSIYETYELLKNNNLPLLNFSQHSNTHMFKSIFDKYDWLIHDSYDKTECGCEPTSLILNAALNEKMFDPIKKRDFKIKENNNNKKNVDEKFNTLNCISTDDYSFIGYTGDLLYNLYNNYPSIYENDSKFMLRPKRLSITH